MGLPKVSAEEWQAARDRLLIKEKEATRSLGIGGTVRLRTTSCSTSTTSESPSTSPTTDKHAG